MLGNMRAPGDRPPPLSTPTLRAGIRRPRRRSPPALSGVDYVEPRTLRIKTVPKTKTTAAKMKV
jgi:hypothetical protein